MSTLWKLWLNDTALACDFPMKPRKAGSFSCSFIHSAAYLWSGKLGTISFVKWWLWLYRLNQVKCLYTKHFLITTVAFEKLPLSQTLLSFGHWKYSLLPLLSAPEKRSIYHGQPFMISNCNRFYCMWLRRHCFISTFWEIVHLLCI